MNIQTNLSNPLRHCSLSPSSLRYPQRCVEYIWYIGWPRSLHSSCHLKSVLKFYLFTTRKHSHTSSSPSPSPFPPPSHIPLPTKISHNPQPPSSTTPCAGPLNRHLHPSPTSQPWPGLPFPNPFPRSSQRRALVPGCEKRGGGGDAQTPLSRKGAPS